MKISYYIRDKVSVKIDNVLSLSIQPPVNVAEARWKNWASRLKRGEKLLLRLAAFAAWRRFAGMPEFLKTPSTTNGI